MIANARMYAINDTVAAVWRALFEWIAREANVTLDALAYPAPLPLGDLWRRDDLGGAMMCGYPWATWHEATGRPVALAAPVPSPPAFADRPIYWTDIVVRDDSRIATLDDLVGTRFAYTTEESQSGYQATRRFFAEPALKRGGQMFATAVGPLITPRRVVEAIVADEADAGPLDAWWHALLCRHEPALAARLRTIATTAPTPIPLVVCSAGIADDIRQRLADAFDHVGRIDALAGVRDILLLDRFVEPATSNYDSLVESARAADALGYHRLR
jgi:ABC-type phosphate/phosphonate transport system substrate-binding protein